MTVPPENHGRAERSTAVPAHQQAADPSRVADDLVEGDGDEVGTDRSHVEAGWSARRRSRRRARPNRRRGPRRRGRADAGRPRSSTAPGRRAGSGPTGRRRRRTLVIAARSRRRSGRVTGTYSTAAPWRRANSRIPFTELWLSNVRANVPPGPNRYDSPTAFRAPVAFGVNTHRYSSGGALKKSADLVASPFHESRGGPRGRVVRVGVAEHRPPAAGPRGRRAGWRRGAHRPCSRGRPAPRRRGARTRAGAGRRSCRRGRIPG